MNLKAILDFLTLLKTKFDNTKTSNAILVVLAFLLFGGDKVITNTKESFLNLFNEDTNVVSVVSTSISNLTEKVDTANSNINKIITILEKK